MNSTAQTKQKRGTKAVPAASPTPSNDVQIVSRADDPNDRIGYLGPPIRETVEPQADPNPQKVKELMARVKKLEAARVNEYDEKQKRLLLNLDILTRAEQRSESLRKQLFDMIEKDNSVKTRLDQIESDSRPEMIARSAAFAGTLKPEEIRDMRKKSLETEKQNLQSLLTQIQITRESLAVNLAKSDTLVDKLRLKLEKDIDDSFKDDDPDK